MTYKWFIADQPDGTNPMLSADDVVNPVFVADADGVYVVHLMVNNGELSSTRGSTLLPGYDGEETDYVGVDRVVVFASSEYTWPVPDAGPDIIRPYIGVESIPLDGSGSYDADGHTITYNWHRHPDKWRRPQCSRG
jgi:hypothetical protein